MKRKLIIGLSLVGFIITLCGAFLTWSLREVYIGDKIKDEQQSIMNSYSGVLFLIKDSQTELYKREAGYSNDEHLLDDDILQAAKRLSLIMDRYASISSLAACTHCHSLEKRGDGEKNTLEKTDYHLKELHNIYDRIILYEREIDNVVVLGHTASARSLLKRVAKDGEEIVDHIETVKNKMEKMNNTMEAFQYTLIKRSIYSTVIAIIISIVLCFTIVILMIRSITEPFNALIHGIERVTSGDYDSRVNIVSNDEIGFLAKTFNTMTDSLSKVTMQKDMLLGELKGLNASLEQRVEEATEELKVAHEEVLRSETLSAVGTFAAGVAHELATPIASIMNYFQMVKERIPEQDKLAEDVQIIERELRRCSTILREMLDFARAPEQEKVSTDINAIIRDLLSLIRYQPGYKKTIVVKEALDPGIPLIPAVPGQLRQVLINIILNAMQSMPGGGALNVSTSLSADSARVLVSISDTGHGIPEGEIKKIFQPFYTGKKSGTGLGLSISYGIIIAHGGDMDIRSETGKGTSFFIYLPVSGEVHPDSKTTEHTTSVT